MYSSITLDGYLDLVQPSGHALYLAVTDYMLEDITTNVSCPTPNFNAKPLVFIKAQHIDNVEEVSGTGDYTYLDIGFNSSTDNLIYYTVDLSSYSLLNFTFYFKQIALCSSSDDLSHKSYYTQSDFTNYKVLWYSNLDLIQVQVGITYKFYFVWPTL